ncbi:capsular biosynthesis protein [Paraburkholderia tropica]|uniref:capsular polysaccharide export protein, LipB/KpsS family n=1 Tax=Paraburkholderia tropica TaxID=92647 RepID=UPI003D29692E
MPRTDGPPLSCFTASLASRTAQAWIDCISAELFREASSDTTSGTTDLMQRFRAAHVFDAASQPPRIEPTLREPAAIQRVLIIDEPTTIHLQPPGDERTQQFARMIATARAAHPRAEFWSARSGAPHTGRWLSSACMDWPGLATRIDPHGSLCASIPHFDQVYTLSAPEGLQALLWGVPLHVFGIPYYAGWGLTHDYVRQPSRRTKATLETLFEATFVRLARHIDPATQGPGTLDSLITGIEAHRNTVSRFADIEQVAGVRFQWWKRTLATPFLTAGGGTMRWVDEAREVKNGEHAAFWGARNAVGLKPHTPILRIEDGFLHSTGLGSDHIAPFSQIIDRRGIYFNPACPSDLTVILNEADFSEAECSRARALRHDIARLGLTKYNLGRRKPAWHAPAGKRVVLVPGQVADDASIRLGTRGITTVEDLLRVVRERHPEAFIVYKPHPDVLSGNRQGLMETSALADVTELNSDLISLVELSDEIHTLSSLSGFEALIRNKTVYTYGLPFYAGWGLTHDALEQPWRKRKLSIDMLTAGVLLRYPVYWDWSLKLFTTPEAVVQQLAVPAARPLTKIHGNRLRPLFKAFRWSANGLRHFAWRYGKRQR